jgi:hypothetical protein
MRSLRSPRAERGPRWARRFKTWHLFWRIARPTAPSPLRAISQSIVTAHCEIATRGESLPIVVYRPARPYATVVLNGGFVPESVDDPRLCNFAAGLAETGFLVLTPDYPAVRALAFTPATIDQIHDVIVHATGDPGLGGGLPSAVIGLSYMGTLSLKAVLRPDLQPPPEFVGVFGGYEDFGDLMQDVFRARYHFEGTAVPVDPYGRFLVLRSVVDYFHPPPGERARIRDLALRCGRRNPPDAIEHEAAGLSPEGRKAFDALRAFDPSRSPDLWRGILHDHREQCEALSVRESAARLRSHLVLLHSGYDHVLPYTHSVRLHQRFPTSELVVTTLFTHVNVRLNPWGALAKLREVGRLSGIFHRLMALQE